MKNESNIKNAIITLINRSQKFKAANIFSVGVSEFLFRLFAMILLMKYDRDIVFVIVPNIAINTLEPSINISKIMSMSNSNVVVMLPFSFRVC